MTDESLEVLSTFIDGETVDPQTLARALTQPGAFEALLEFARFRSEIAADTSRPSDRFYRSMDRCRRVSLIPRERILRAVVTGFAATILVAIGVAAGVWLRSSETRQPSTPPPATREVSFTPGVDWFRSSSS